MAAPKFFSVFYWNQRTRKLEDRGAYHLGLFKQQYGAPVERKIFDEAITSGKIFVTQVQPVFPLDQPWLLYHRTLEELQSEVDELKSKIDENALSLL